VIAPFGPARLKARANRRGLEDDPNDLSSKSMVDRWNRGYSDTMELVRGGEIKKLAAGSGVVIREDPPAG
jgi:hypothetical protein